MYRQKSDIFPFFKKILTIENIFELIDFSTFELYG
jgi:hypothetical protein